MDHDVKRVVAAGVASIHVLLQQNYARRAATNFPGCRKRLERRGDVAQHRSCAVMRLRNIGCTIFSEGCVEWIQQTQLDDTNTSSAVFFGYRYQACRRMSLLHQGQPSTGSARVPPDADRPSFETPSRSSMAICATRVRGGTTSSPKVAAAGSNYRIAIALGRLGLEIEQNPANPRALGTPGNARLAEGEELGSKLLRVHRRDRG